MLKLLDAILEVIFHKSSLFPKSDLYTHHLPSWDWTASPLDSMQHAAVALDKWMCDKLGVGAVRWCKFSDLFLQQFDFITVMASKPGTNV